MAHVVSQQESPAAYKIKAVAAAAESKMAQELEALPSTVAAVVDAVQEPTQKPEPPTAAAVAAVQVIAEPQQAQVDQAL
jgi:hypothetical protein